MRNTATWHGPRGHANLTVAAVAIALHVGVIAILLQLQPVRSALTAAAPIMVKLISPAAAPEKPQTLPKPLPVKPRVQRPEPAQQAPVITTSTEVSTTFSAPAVPQTPVQPAIETVVAAPVAPPALAPAPVVAPRFDADYLNNPAPAYPLLSRRMGEEGKVMLRVHVDERGLPDDVQLKSSSGFPRLDATALDTVRHWKFVPARRGDSPVAAWVLVPISFSLRS